MGYDGPVDAMGHVIDPAMQSVARLRYDIYCVERGFVDPASCPDGYELDEYDRFSVPIAVADGGEVLAALRLVLDSPLGFPLEKRAQELYSSYERMEPARTAEISRLVVARSHRDCPAVLLRLFRKMYEQSVRRGLTYWLAAMEPALDRRLRRLVGIEFTPVGPSMDYYGEVLPYGAAIHDVERTLEQRRPELHRYFGMPSSQPVSSGERTAHKPMDARTAT